MRAFLAALLLLLYAVPLNAQTGVPVSWTLRIYTAGSAGTTNMRVVTTAEVQCNQASPATTSTVNPTRWVWDDVANVGRVCIADDVARLQALPDGNYEGTAQAVNADGSSSESARAPFSRRRPNPPPAPTGLRFTN